MPTGGEDHREDGFPDLASATLSAVAVSVGGRPVLDCVSLKLERSSVFVLLGENGAGKTTLMRTLCGRTSPHRGRVTVLDADPRIDAGARAAVGFVPRSVALHPELTVRQNLTAFRSLAPRDGNAPCSVAAILRQTRLEHVADRRVGELSGGYQRRANVAATLVNDPAVLLLDEPTVGLDAAAKDTLVEVLGDAARRGVAVMMTTHDLDVAEALADRVGFLVSGRIAAEGAPGELSAQVFEGRHSLAFTPATAADAVTRVEFEDAGLGFSEAEGTWHGPSRGASPEALRLVADAAKPRRLGTRRLEVVEPGLRELYHHHVGRGHGRD